MALKKRIQLRNVQNVGDSKTVLIECPIGPRYHWVGLQMTYTSGTNTAAGVAAHFTMIRVKCNGRIQREFSGSELRDLNILNGAIYDISGVPNTAPGATLPIFFAEPWRKDPNDQDALALPTVAREGALSSFQIEIDTSAVIATSAGLTLVAYAVVDDFVPDRFRMTKIKRISTPNGGNAFDFTTLDKKDFLSQITIYPDSSTSAALTKATLRINGDIKHELTQLANTALNVHHGMIAPGASGRTAGVYDLVLDHDDLLSSSYPLDGVNDIGLTIEAGGSPAGTTVLQVQRIGGLD